MIADLVRLTQPTISRMTAKWISFLYLKLSSLPLWPTSEQAKASLPECFRTKYDKTFVIIDCTEIKCEVPSSQPLQSHLYSSYKSHATLKCLLGISPAGAVIFVSKLYTGSISDREVTQRSGFLDLLKTLPFFVLCCFGFCSACRVILRPGKTVASEFEALVRA